MHDLQLALKKAIQYEPNNVKYIHQCAVAAESIQNNDAANKYYLKALSLDPNNSKYCIHYGRFLCKNLRDFEQSRIYYQKAISLQPENCTAYYRFAKILRNYMGDYEEAEKYYLKCLELKHDGFGIHGSYGYLLYLMGDVKKAMEYIKIQLDLDDESKWAHLYYGALNNVLGNDELKKSAMLKAVEFTSKMSSYKYIVRELQVLKMLDSSNVEYYQQFEQLLHRKFKRRN